MTMVSGLNNAAYVGENQQLKVTIMPRIHTQKAGHVLQRECPTEESQ